MAYAHILTWVLNISVMGNMEGGSLEMVVLQLQAVSCDFKPSELDFGLSGLHLYFALIIFKGISLVYLLHAKTRLDSTPCFST